MRSKRNLGRHRGWRAILTGALLGLSGPASADGDEAPCEEPVLDDAEIVAVFNATDEDAQLIIAGGLEDGSLEVSVQGPAGVRLESEFADRRQLGQADFQFDTTEPSLQVLRRAYPPGRYKVEVTTTDGCDKSRTLLLSYKFVPAPEIVFPTEGATGVPAAGFIAIWEEIDGADAIRVAVEDPDGGTLKVDLPGDATSFPVPAEFLQSGVLYTMDVIGIAENGNQTVSDVQFTTGP